MAKQQIEGPYRVKNIGVNGNVYEVVEMLDESKNQHAELRPRRIYSSKPHSRQTAYQAMVRLNRRWQQDHLMDDVL